MHTQFIEAGTGTHSILKLTVEEPYILSKIKIGIRVLTEISAEALGFAVAAVAMRILIPSFYWPLAGIAGGLFCAKLVIKVVTPYNLEPLMDLTYEACKLCERYPKLQSISFLFAMSISLLSSSIAMASGIAIGIYGAILLDVEKYKQLQKESCT